MRQRARVLLVEAVLPDRVEPSVAKLFDLEMLALTPGGRQRSETEYRALLYQAGFTVSKSVAARLGEPTSYTSRRSQSADPKPRAVVSLMREDGGGS